VALPEAADFIRSVSAMPGLKLGGVYTHLPYSDEAGRAWAEKQGHAFSDMVSAIAREGIRIPVTQMLSSPGILCGAASRHNAIAPGSLLYGLSRFGRGGEPSMQGFRPALRSVTTTLLHVGRRLAGAEAAPYLRNGHSTLGVVPIGIHHGYRPTSPRAHMIVGGSEAPVLRVCLESTILDLSGAPNSAIGTEATVLGRSADREITLDRLAEWQQTSPLLLLTALGKSIPRFPT
jgi:alanine racemase